MERKFGSMIFDDTKFAKASGNTSRMENGGKRKRVGLSLKSFKTPALNYVKKQSVGKRLDKGPSGKGKSNSGLGKINLASQEEIETPISENRMKLFSLMPRFPNWNRMAPFPLNPLIKSLTETQSEVNDKRTEIHINPNSHITNEVEKRNYIDLPKLGIRFFSHQIKAQFITSNENYQCCMEINALKPSEIEMKQTEIAECEFGLDRSKLTDSKHNRVHKDRECKQKLPKFSLNTYSKKDETNHGYKSSIQESGNVLRSTDKGQSQPSQSNSAVVRIDVDLTDDIEDYSDLGFDDFECNGPSLSNKANIGIGTVNNRFLNLSKGKSTAGSKNTDLKDSNENSGLVNVISTSIKDKTSNGHNRTNSQLRTEENEKKKQYKIGYTKLKDGKSFTTNFENTFCHNSEDVVQNSPPKKERQTGKDRHIDYKDPLEQASKSMNNSVNARQNISKVNSLYSTSYTETQASRPKSKPAYGSKDIPKSSSSYNTSQKVPQAHTSTSKSKLSYTRTNIPKLNISINDQHATKTKSSQINKGNPKLSSFYTTSNKPTPVQANKMNKIPFYESKDISKINTSDNVPTRRDQHGRAMWKSSQANKNNPKPNSFYTTSNRQAHVQARQSKETPAYANKTISKTSSFYSRSDKLRTSGGNCSTSKNVNDGGLGSDEDLFGSDDSLDELLAKSFSDDFEQNSRLGTQGDSKDLIWIEKDDDGGMENLLGNLDNDMDDDILVACCDDAMSPTIPVRENASTSKFSGSVRNEVSSKGVKRRLNIPDAQSKVRRSENSDDGLKECPFCANSFHSGFSKRDIGQHIAMCCSNDDIGNDNGFW